ncbi:MAG TPA: ankyrin repeat domain-containing protein [Actinomycetota bacterium]|nr:ankyrin repeat domain-containing protein [Actinomycetota bacterium]
MLPDRPSLEHLRKQAKALQRERGTALSQAQQELARDYGFDSWPRLVHHVRAAGLEGIEQALSLADPAKLEAILESDPGAVTSEVAGLQPLLYLLRNSTGTGSDIRTCTRLLLDAGADPNAHTVEDGHGHAWEFFALRSAVDRNDVELARMLIEAGAKRDQDAMYHACERSNNAMLDVLWEPGLEYMVGHKLDFEDVPGLQWFLDHGVDVNKDLCLHHAIARGRSLTILNMLLDAGADVNVPWDRWDVGRRPLALAARSGHLAAYELLLEHGATAELDPVDEAVLAVARGESVQLPKAPPPALGNPEGDDYGWILGQFALLDRDDVVKALLDSGMHVDTRAWSNFTPLDQAAMHGRTRTVKLLIERGADLTDCAFNEEGPTPLDCAIWGLRNNRALDGDYVGTVEALAAAGAPTRHQPPSPDPKVDEVLRRHGIW